MKRLIISSLLVICAAALVVSLGTFAYFSDTANSTDNVFTAGTLNIEAGTATWTGSVTNIKPGDTITLSLDVNSIGSLPLDYTVTPALAGDLAGGANPCTAGNIATDGVPGSTGSLSASGGSDASDTITIDVTMPAAAGNEYQAKSGTISLTIDAVQQP